MAQAVCQRCLPLLVRLLQQFGQQEAEGVHQWQQQAPHQCLLPLHCALAAHNQHPRRLEHEQLVVAGQQCREAVLLLGDTAGKGSVNQAAASPGGREGSWVSEATYRRRQLEQVLDAGQDVLNEGVHVFAVGRNTRVVG